MFGHSRRKFLRESYEIFKLSMQIAQDVLNNRSEYNIEKNLIKIRNLIDLNQQLEVPTSSSSRINYYDIRAGNYSALLSLESSCEYLSGEHSKKNDIPSFIDDEEYRLKGFTRSYDRYHQEVTQQLERFTELKKVGKF
jgi:hypothetical protein